MGIIQIVAIGAIGTFVTIMLRQYKPELAIFTSIITAILILSQILGAALPIIDEIKSLLDKTAISYEHLTIILKAVGICYLTQFICDVCKETGQTAIGNKIELAGRVALCIISLPLFQQLISVIETIIGKVT